MQRRVVTFMLCNALLFGANIYLLTYHRGAPPGQAEAVLAVLRQLSKRSLDLEETRKQYAPRMLDDPEVKDADVKNDGQMGQLGVFQWQKSKKSTVESHVSKRTETVASLETNTPIPDIPPNWEILRKNYKVPDIKTPKNINCAAILEGNLSEIKKAENIMEAVPKVPIYEETYEELTEDCDRFKRLRGYVTVPLTKEEEEYPLAFSLSMYTDVEQAERILRAVYQPQNLYCFHIDTKTSLLIHRTMASIVKCFPNVFIAEHLDKIKWGDVSVLLPAINCMRHLIHHYRKKFKYFINLTGQEIPLRTNWELVQIAKVFNGSNDIAGSKPRMEMDRVDYHWTHRWSKTYQQTIFYNTYQPKPPFEYNLTFFKGELHGLFSHNMVEFIVENEISKKYLQWCWDSGHPTEHYWNVLNYNTWLKAPGGYEGPLDIAHKYSYNVAVRAKHWVAQNYGNRQCEGKVTRGICVYGLRDLPWLHTRNEMVANKFHLTFQYFAFDCLEERHRNRTKMGAHVPFNATFYKNLPTVLFSRKDGVS